MEKKIPNQFVKDPLHKTVDRSNFTSKETDDIKHDSAPFLEPNYSMVEIVPVEKDATEYNMSHPERGHALIFNTVGPELAETANIDIQHFETMCRALEFKIKRFDCCISTVYKALKEFAKNNHNHEDCVLVAIISKRIRWPYDTSYESFYTQYISPLRGDNCSSLIGKPKLIFIQEYQIDPKDLIQKIEEKKEESDMILYKIPTTCDFYTIYNTSSAKSTTGGIFYKHLNEMLQKNIEDYDLLTLVARVSNKMSSEDDIPCRTSNLIREIYFRPKKENSLS